MAVGHVVYEWRVEEDRLTWSQNASEILGVADLSDIASGRDFANLLDPENLSNRYEAVMNSPQVDEGEGVPFQIEYRIMPKGAIAASGSGSRIPGAGMPVRTAGRPVSSGSCAMSRTGTSATSICPI